MRYDTSDLNLRAFGTKVSSRMLVPIPFLDPRRRAILLIHGYNVNEAEALSAMGLFRRTLAHYAPSLLDDTFLCTWAGNWNIPGLRPFAYPFMLHHARESALTLLEAIQQWYARLSAPEELVIVAHSLGCRLALEMLLGLEVAGRPVRLRRLIVILMAATIPTEHFVQAGRLFPTLRVADITVVLYSQDDNVLAWAFGLGQTLGGDGWFPEAVGLRANPPGTPWTHAQQMRSFDHGDYWHEMETAALVCGVLGLSVRSSELGVPLAARKALRGRGLPLLPLLPVT
jgi:Alpha/beta hydrolase of unknown function (DUF900)